MGKNISSPTLTSGLDQKLKATKIISKHRWETKTSNLPVMLLSLGTSTNSAGPMAIRNDTDIVLIRGKSIRQSANNN